MKEEIFEKEIAGKKFTFKTGLMAKQANGSVLASIENSVVLAPVVMSKNKVTGDFFPLTVNYSEKYYAAGKIPGGFFKREGRPRVKEILVSRLIDRPIRPLFADGFRNEIQISPMTVSIDAINPQDIVAINASSAALTISDIPFNGPIGAVRVGKIEDKYIINPTYEEIEKSKINLVVAGTKNAITMIEGHSEFATEEEMLEALKEAHEAVKEIVALQIEMQEKIGKPKTVVELNTVDENIVNKVKSLSKDKLEANLINKHKLERQDKMSEIYSEIEPDLIEEFGEENVSIYKNVFHDYEKELVRDLMLNKDKRIDERNFDEIRPIDCRVNLIPNVHGSALFTRGETQALMFATLGSLNDEQMFDDLEGDFKKNFLLHYNFPPYSVGECGRSGFTGRREIGHGTLAEVSLLPVLPPKDKFVYTIRLVSEILESNGSSSMATVCSGTMALLSAGVPLTDNVAGVAMGLIKENDNYKVITDIQGLEDHFGDMDFKVSGTRTGITGFQMDIKIEGITFDIMKDAMEKARVARIKILDKMEEAIKTPNKDVAKTAPRYEIITIDKDKIGALIGPGGKNIKKIVEETGSDVNIDDDGKVHVFSKNQDQLVKTVKKIESFTQSAVLNEIYEGKVIKIMNFGAFIEILPGIQGLCHISEFTEDRLEKVEDFVKEGNDLTVKVIKMDNGKISLSHKKAVSKY